MERLVEKMNIDEFPKHPLPHVPPPEEPQRRQVQPPTVFVHEKQGWESPEHPTFASRE